MTVFILMDYGGRKLRLEPSKAQHHDSGHRSQQSGHSKLFLGTYSTPGLCLDHFICLSFLAIPTPPESRHSGHSILQVRNPHFQKLENLPDVTPTVGIPAGI